MINTYITSDAHAKLWTFIDAMKVEIGGLGYGKIERIRDGFNVIWYDTFLLPQKVSSSAVDFTEDSFAFAVERAAKDGKLNDPDFVWCSWHSHHSMKAFWSVDDAKCISRYGEQGVPYLLSFVGCHDRDYKVRFDHFGVEYAGLHIGQVTFSDLKLQRDPADPLFGDIQAEIDHQVTEVKTWYGNNSWRANTWHTKGQPVKELKASVEPTDEEITAAQLGLTPEELQELGVDVTELMGSEDKFIYPREAEV